MMDTIFDHPPPCSFVMDVNPPPPPTQGFLPINWKFKIPCNPRVRLLVVWSVGSVGSKLPKRAGKVLFPSDLTPPPAPSTNQYSPMLTQTYSSSNEVPHLFGDYLLKISSK